MANQKNMPQENSGEQTYRLLRLYHPQNRNVARRTGSAPAGMAILTGKSMDEETAGVFGGVHIALLNRRRQAGFALNVDLK